MSLIESAIRRPVAVISLVFMVILMGFVSLQLIPIQLTPDLRKPVVSLHTNWPGASPTEVEGLLIYAAIPLDEAAQELPDMIIRNVLIMEAGSKSDHTLVNIQIRNGHVAAVRVAPM